MVFFFQTGPHTYDYDEEYLCSLNTSTDKDKGLTNPPVRLCSLARHGPCGRDGRDGRGTWHVLAKVWGVPDHGDPAAGGDEGQGRLHEAGAEARAYC